MLIVNCPVMQNQVIEALEAHDEPTFKFIKKDGIKLYFETNDEDREAAAKVAKAVIKDQPFGKSIVFNVKTEEYV